MLLDITDVGFIAETDAIATGSMSPVAAVLIGDGVPHADSGPATAMVHQVASIPVQTIERISPQAVRVYATIPQGETITVREIGLQLADGTLYGYLPYSVRAGAPLHKDTHFAFSFSLAIARFELPPIEVLYNPLDTAALAADIADQALSTITDYNGRLAGAEAGILAEQQARASAIAQAEIDVFEAILTPFEAFDIAYDASGNIASIIETLPSGTRALSYVYDDDGRVAQAVSVLHDRTRTEVYTYNDDGRLIGMMLGVEDPE